MISKLKSLLLSKEFQKFFVVGILAFFIDFGLLNLQVYIFKFNLVLFGFVFVPNVISYIASITFGFFAQKLWTFGQKSKKEAAKEGGKFVIVSILNLVVYNAFFFGFLYNLGVFIPIAKIITTGTQMISSFVLYKYFVFGGKKDIIQENY